MKDLLFFYGLKAVVGIILDKVVKLEHKHGYFPFLPLLWEGVKYEKICPNKQKMLMQLHV